MYKNNWDKEKFIERLRKIAKPNTGAFAAKCVGVSDQLFRGYLSGAIPGIDKAISIANQAGVSLDWLLTGEEARTGCPISCDERMRELCGDVKELVESKTHWGDSLESNIKSFKKGLDNDRELDNIKKRLDNLEHTASPGPDTGTTKKTVKRTGLKKKAV